MAATIAKAIGVDKTREKHVHRLGHEHSEGQANTWRTFSTARVERDGSGYLEVCRKQHQFRVRFNTEDDDLLVTIEHNGVVCRFDEC